VQSSASRRSRSAALALAGGLWLAAGAAAEEKAEAPVVPLDKLLKLPASAPVEASVERLGGSTRAEWQTRFQTARRELSEAEQALETTRKELEKAGGDSQWTMAAPGLGGGGAASSDSPLDYKLSQDLRRQRDELLRAHQRLQDLEVEANLAGVPEGWRRGDASTP
jgi:hypothetical protein